MTKSQILPWIFFGGRCEEALDFYRTALGAEVDMIQDDGEGVDVRCSGGLLPGGSAS